MGTKKYGLGQDTDKIKKKVFTSILREFMRIFTSEFIDFGKGEGLLIYITIAST